MASSSRDDISKEVVPQEVGDPTPSQEESEVETLLHKGQSTTSTRTRAKAHLKTEAPDLPKR